MRTVDEEWRASGLTLTADMPHTLFSRSASSAVSYPGEAGSPIVPIDDGGGIHRWDATQDPDLGLHAWEVFGSTVLRVRMSSDDYGLVESTRETEVAAEFDSLLGPYGFQVGDPNVHLVAGDPILEIPRLVSEKDIDLIVMGTITRSGVPGMLMGNVAESILDRIECPVLALKPQGFVSPVTIASSSPSDA